MLKPSTLAVTAVFVLSLLAAAGASAATEVGNPCTANKAELAPSFTFLSAANAPGNPMPAIVPAAGVITRWTSKAPPAPPNVIAQTLRVFRPTADPKRLLVVGESPPGPLGEGANTFAARIPVEAGDRIGLTSSFPVVYYCETGAAGDAVTIATGGPATGTTAEVGPEVPNAQIPLVAVVEPDADRDGYGDESQDRCPQSAAYQGACPVVALGSTAVAGKGAATLFVSSSLTASVTVSGSIKLPPTKTAGKRGGAASLALTAPIQVVGAGQLPAFRLAFPQRLKTRLRELSRKRSLTLTIQASAPNLVGPPTTQSTRLKLRGQG